MSLNLLDSATGKVLAQKSVRVSSAQGQQTVQLEFIPDKPGELKLRVALEPLPGEINVANNAIEHPIVVENRTIKVLLVFGNPSTNFASSNTSWSDRLKIVRIVLRHSN